MDDKDKALVDATTGLLASIHEYHRALVRSAVAEIFNAPIAATTASTSASEVSGVSTEGLLRATPPAPRVTTYASPEQLDRMAELGSVPIEPPDMPGPSPNLAWAELPQPNSRGPTDVQACLGLMAAMRLVGQFHEKCRVAETQRLDSPSMTVACTAELHVAARTLSGIAEAMCSLMRGIDDQDRRALRAHLMVEELGELLEAMAARDEVKTLDAMADLLYVLIGSAVTLDLPLAEAFVEVHSSNMTKQRQENDPDGARVRDKGPNYVAPDLERVLSLYRGDGESLLLMHRAAAKNPCAELREKLEDPEQGPGSYGDAPNRHSPHLMSENMECVHCGMTEYAIISQRNRVGKPKCTGMPGA